MALSILGSRAVNELQSESSESEHVTSQALRAFVAVRSRYAEDELARAVDGGVRQYVLLGAGLDTFAYRNPHAGAGLRVFEVDHPSTQLWKLEQLRMAGIPIPAEAIFVPVDFERQSLGEALEAAGFCPDRSAFFGWLGVVPYLTEGAFTATASYIAGMPPGTGVVFDYALARSSLSPRQQFALNAMAQRVAAAGEPFRLFFDPGELAGKLRRSGFRHLVDLGPKEINASYFSGRSDDLRVKGGLAHLMSAWV